MKKYLCVLISSLMATGCISNTANLSADSAPTNNSEQVEELSSASSEVAVLESKGDQARELYKLGVKYEDSKDGKQNLVKAKEYYEKAISLGSIDAANALGALYANTGDYENAKKYLLIASNQGDEIANFNLGGMSFVYYKGSKQKTNQEAIKYYKLSADKGYAPALIALGDMYATGDGAIPNEKFAEDYYLKAVELNDSVAMERLALLYLFQEDVNGDGSDSKTATKSIELFKKVAENGNPKAMYILSMAYQNGLYVEKDEVKGLQYLMQSAQAGYVEAEYALAYLYLTGMFVEKNYEQGVYFMSKAANQNFPSAQNNLGMLYLKGEVVPKDLKVANYWLNQASNNGYSMADYNLGLVNELGLGVSKNPKKAGEYFLKAANNGYEEAVLKVVNMYGTGSLGVSKNNETARMWLDRAIEQQSGNAMLIKATAYYFGGYGYSKDQQRAKEWLDKAKQIAPEQAQKVEESWIGRERLSMSMYREAKASEKDAKK